MSKASDNVPIALNSFNELQDDRVKDPELEIIDKRDFGFFIVDNAFVDQFFDVYTMAVYMRIVRRAHRSEQGFFEYQKTTCEALGISQSKLRRCNALLAFCNVIKIQHRKNPKNPKTLMSSKITLVDQKNWNLNHKFRDAEVFAKAKRIPLSPEKKIEIQESKLKRKLKLQEKPPPAVPCTLGVAAHEHRRVGIAIKDNLGSN